MADHSYNHLSVQPNQKQSQNNQLQQVTNSSVGEQASGNLNKSLVRGNSVVTLNQIYQHHNSIPVRNRILNTAKSLYSSVEVPTFANGGPDSLPDDTILLPAGGTSAQRYTLSPGDRTAARLNYPAGQQQHKSVQSSQLQPSALHHQQRLQQQQQQNQARNVQATPPSKYPTHSLATSPVRVINVARRHKKQTGAMNEPYVTGRTSSCSLVGSSQAGEQTWPQNTQQQSVLSGSPRKNILAAAWSSDSSSCSSSRDASPIQGTSPAQQRSPTNSARQLEVQQQQQQVCLPRSTSPSPTKSRGAGSQLAAPSPSDTGPLSNQSSKQQQQKSPSPRRRVLPKIGTANQSHSFAPDTSPAHQRHAYLDSGPAAAMTGQAAGGEKGTQSANTSMTKRHRKLPQIPTQASVQQQQLNISCEQLQFNSGNQLQSEATTIQATGSSYVPSISARRVTPHKSLSSSSSASSNSPTVLDVTRGSGCGVVLSNQPITRQQTLALTGQNSSTGGQPASVRNQNFQTSGEQLRVLSFPMPSESQQAALSSLNAGASLVCPLARANTLVHPPSLGQQSNRSTALNETQCSAYGQQQQAGHKQASPLIRHSASSSSSSNSPAAVTGNNRSPSYSQQQHQMSRFFTFEPAQTIPGDLSAPSLITTAPIIQNSPFTSYNSVSERQVLAAPPSLVSGDEALVADQPSGGHQLDHQLNVSSQRNQNEQANCAGRGRRLSSCGSGLRANFLMNKQHAISEFTPPRSLESSTSRGSTDAGTAMGGPQMMPCTTATDVSLVASHSTSYTQPTTPTMFAPEELMGVGVANNSNSNNTGNNSSTNNNLDWNVWSNATADSTNAHLAGSNFEFAGVAGNRSMSTQNIRSCESATTLGSQAATNLMSQKSPIISSGDSSLAGQSSHQQAVQARPRPRPQTQARPGSGISSSNCDLQLNLQNQQQLVNSINELRNKNGSLSPRFSKNLNTSSACPIVSIGNYTAIANYMQRRPSAALAGLPPRAASATEASSLQPHDVLNTATSSNLTPNSFATDSSNFHRTLSANVKPAPPSRSMIMQTSSVNYITSSDVAFSGAGSTFCSGGGSKPILTAATATTTTTTPSSSSSITTTTTSTMGSNFSRERGLLPSLAATNALSVDVYHNGNEDSYTIPSVMPSASVATTATNLSPSFVGGPAKQQGVYPQSEHQQHYFSQHEQRNSLVLPSPRDRQHSNVSTNSMPAGALIAIAPFNASQPQQEQQTSLSGASPGYCSPKQGAAGNLPLAASLSQASSGEVQKARKFGAWAERIAASSSNNNASGTTKHGIASKHGSANISSSSSRSTSRRACSTSQLDGQADKAKRNGQRSALRRSISDSSTASSSCIDSSGDENNLSAFNNRTRSFAGREGETSETSGENDHPDGTSIDSAQLSTHNNRHSSHRRDINPSSTSSCSSSLSHSSDSTSSDNGRTNTLSRNQNEFGHENKKTIRVRRQKKKRHKQKKRHSSRPTTRGNSKKQEETLRPIIGAGGKSVDQLTLSDRLKLAERSANELFRKVELSPQSQLAGTTKQGSLDSSSTTAAANQNTFFSSNTLFGPANSGYQSRIKSQSNSAEEQQQQSHLKNNYNLDKETIAQTNFSAPKGVGESHEFADDEQCDDLSLFLRSVDKQRLKQRQKQQQQQQQRHHDSSDKFNSAHNNKTLYKDKESSSNASTNAGNNNNNNTFSSKPLTRLDKQTSKLLRNVKGSLRLGKLRQNNSISGFHSSSLRQQQSLALKDEMMMHHHQQTIIGSDNSSTVATTPNSDAGTVKIQHRPPKVVRRAITLRSLAKTFSWRTNSCEHQQQESLTNKNRANLSRTERPSFEIEPESNLHARLLAASSAAPLTNLATTTSAAAAAATTTTTTQRQPPPISPGNVASSGRAAIDHGAPATPLSKDPQQQTRRSGGQWLLQSATANPFSSFQRPSLSSFSQRFSSSSQRGEKVMGARGSLTKRGSQSRNGSSCSVEAMELTQHRLNQQPQQSAAQSSNLSTGNIVRAGSASGADGYYGMQAAEQRRGTSTLTKHHRSLGRMKSVITTVSRRLETLRLMKGKQAYSDDCSATANYSDNSGEIRCDTRNLYAQNDCTDVENGDNNSNINSSSHSRNNEFR